MGERRKFQTGVDARRLYEEDVQERALQADRDAIEHLGDVQDARAAGDELQRQRVQQEAARKVLEEFDWTNEDGDIDDALNVIRELCVILEVQPRY